ncbi:MAG: leucyl aminopeptidase [Acidimicrobiia bacterium]
MEFEVSRESTSSVDVDMVALPVLAGDSPRLGPGADQLDSETGGELSRFIRAFGFKAEKGETLVLPSEALGGKTRAPRVMLVGVGKPGTLTAQTIRETSAAVVRSAKNAKTIATTLWKVDESVVDAPAALRATAEGAGLASYRFDRYKSSNSNTGANTCPEKLVLAECPLEEASAALIKARCVVEAVCWARDMVNEPAGSKAPAVLAEEIRRRAEEAGLAVEVWGRDRLERERLGGVIGVGKGSSNDPCLVRLEYVPAQSQDAQPLCLVGKGVVFDSGGLSLKPADGMETMKTDMSGAAAVAAAMSALRGLEAKVRVVGFLPLVENMPSGSATKPGDVLVFRNSKTVEVLNTDAEGRLIMADALSLSSELKPRAIVDLATLTGACMVALGNKIFGVMANNDDFAAAVLDAASRAGERAWRLPLPADYRKQLESEVADIKNIGSRYGGALTAGLFLQEFVEEGIPWAHLDIAGPARSEADEFEIPKGGTGVGVRTLLALIEAMGS